MPGSLFSDDLLPGALTTPVSVPYRLGMLLRSLLLIVFASGSQTLAMEVSLPTANAMLFEPAAEAQYFQGTAGRDWRSGRYGCVRSDGRQFHEGVDIRCIHRDRRGMPLDPVVAVSEGEVAYIASVAGSSNYGRYVVIRHRWDGVEVYSLYAHLASIAPGVRAGQSVMKGQVIGTLGFSGTQEMPKERAHLHFEIVFQLNRNFAAWFAPRLAKGDRNDHGSFSGLNLIGIDPEPVLRAAQMPLNFREHMEAQPIAATVLFPARRAPLSWMRAQNWCIVNGPEPAPVTAWR